MSNSVKIAHVTSVHARDDVRIFVKMCTSLAKEKRYDVTLVVADGKGNDEKNGVRIVDAGRSEGGRIKRMSRTLYRVYKTAVSLECDIYHLHDPELLVIALLLKRRGKKVIFDSHEDVSQDILSKTWIPVAVRGAISLLYARFESFVCKRLDYVVAATPYIRDKFLCINPDSVDINNYPIIGELERTNDWSSKKDEVCYVGGINKIRGIKEIVEAMALVKNIRLNLVGNFMETIVKDEVKSLKGWEKVNEYGFLGREKVAKILHRSKAGLVTLHPIPTYRQALPVKMFEYMSTGLPVIASDFPLWREIIEGNESGICVNPLDPKEIAEAIEFLIKNPKEAKRMGENGKRAVLSRYNWAIEEKKLYTIYWQLSGTDKINLKHQNKSV